jgi:hypothetical protein
VLHIPLRVQNVSLISCGRNHFAFGLFFFCGRFFAMRFTIGGIQKLVLFVFLSRMLGGFFFPANKEIFSCYLSKTRMRTTGFVINRLVMYHRYILSSNCKIKQFSFNFNRSVSRSQSYQ